MANTTELPVAIVLGGTVPHCELVRNLQARGYYVALVDYLEMPPAAEVADEHIRESTLDPELVLKIAREIGAVVVISTCIDQANVTACYVMEKLGLQPPYSYEASLLVSNKVPMKRRMRDFGVPTSKFLELKNPCELEGHDLTFPVVVKPADSNSSKGVRVAENDSQAKLYIEDALNISRSGDAIVEEFVVGVEIGVDCYVFDGEAHIVMTKERRKFNSSCGDLQQIYGCYWPAELSEDIFSSLTEIATKIAKAFGLKNTPLMIQGILNDDGFNVIEFAPRIGGGESFRLIKRMTGFDYVDAAVQSFLGVEPSCECNTTTAVYADNFIYSKAGCFDRIAVPDALIEDGTIDYIQAYRKPGTLIGSDLSSNNRVGVFTVKAATREELNRKIERAQNAIEVYDVDGRSMMRRDIYAGSFDC